MKTGIITTDTYSNHNTGQGHPENADRVSIVIENLKKINNKNLVWKKPSKFDVKYLKITHNANYVSEVEKSLVSVVVGELDVFIKAVAIS